MKFWNAATSHTKLAIVNSEMMQTIKQAANQPFHYTLNWVCDYVVWVMGCFIYRVALLWFCRFTRTAAEDSDEERDWMEVDGMFDKSEVATNGTEGEAV